MAFQSVPDTAEAVPAFLINGEVCTLTFYGRISGGYSQSDIDALASEMDIWVGLTLLPALSTQVTYLGTTVRGLELLNDLTAFDSTNTGAGTVAAQPLPNQSCISIKRASNLTGRSARGRVYMFLNTADVDANENFIVAGSATGYVALFNDVAPAMFAAGWTEVIVSRYTGGALRATGVTFPVIQYSMVNRVIKSQQRRMPGK